MYMKIGLIGLGLIGGSIAKAIRLAEPETEITAYDVDPNALALAGQEGCIDAAADGVTKEAFGACDYLFLCAPVSENDGMLEQIAGVMKAGAVLTDVGSVKGDIHAHIRRLNLETCFIGGHPMAGSEKTGYENADANLFENVYYLITPTARTSKEQLAGYERLIRDMRAVPLVMTPEKHDYVTGAVSHLPHVIAAALVNFVRENDQEDGVMKMIAAGGFRDITRIASSSPVMWEAICMTNTEQIVALLDAYMVSLASIREMIKKKDGGAVYDFFDSARNYRDSFQISDRGALRSVYALHVDIPDEPGTLAAIAALLAKHGISIKNIGIIHNREHEEGVLRVEFYDEEARGKAEELLTALQYHVYHKQ
ncbi:MAG: prephenate dehydrogenase [Clostridium sp.]|nr:prephenate dehydrogenase [Clostridium sp.]